jgi:hypothetical protein
MIRMNDIVQYTGIVHLVRSTNVWLLRGRV